MNRPRYDLHGKIAVVTLPVLAHDEAEQVRTRQLQEAIASAQSDQSVAAIVLMPDERDPLAPRTALDGAALRWAIDTVEASRKPVVCALGKQCIGATLELALACHYRVAETDTQVALPDIQRGQLPALGAMTRLPRLIGIDDALDLILSRDNAAAPELAGKLFDQIVAHDARSAALTFAEELVRMTAPPRPTNRLPFDCADVPSALRTALNVARTRYPKSTPPRQCIETVAAVLERSTMTGADQGPNVLDLLSRPPTGTVTDYAAWCEASATQTSSFALRGSTRPLQKVAIVGAGIIGTGIAATITALGVPVTLIDKKRTAIDTSLGAIAAIFEKSRRNGKLTADEASHRTRLVKGSLDYDDIRDADLVIEAVFEEMDIKEEVFQKLDRILKPGAILATSTSTLNVDDIAKVTTRPADVVGLHFFSPARKMPLLEVVRGKETSDDVLASVVNVGKALDKLVFVSRARDGLIGNCLLDQYWRQALFLIEEGCAVERIDLVMESWGMAMGPFRLMDLVGNDLHWAIRRRRYVEQPAMNYSRIADKLCELGRFGQKTEAGWYRYESPEGAPIPDDAVDALIRSHRDEIDSVDRQITDEEIVNRLVFALINESARILESDPALSPSDIDTVYVAGYGFPRRCGGPMYYADTVGIERIMHAMNDFAEHARGDPAFWTPAPLLVHLAATRKRLCA